MSLYIESETMPGTFADRGDVLLPTDWIVPPECQGQMIEESYAFAECFLFRRRFDRSDRTEKLSCVDCDLVTNEDWHPVNGRPDIARDAWRRVETFDADRGLDLADDLTSDRGETAPLLPESIEIDGRGRILAAYSEGSYAIYESLETFADAHELPALKIGGDTIEAAQ